MTPTEKNDFLNWYGEDRWLYARKTGGVSIETIEQYVQHRLRELAKEVPSDD